MAKYFSSCDEWNDFRRQMPVTKNWAYFDHAAVAPLSGPAREAITNWTLQAAEEGDTIWPQWAHRMEQIRATAAETIGAGKDEIALVPNTTAGINLVAEGFPWREGDNIVTLAGEFPSNLYPWMNLAHRGVETRHMEMAGAAVDLERIVEACDQRTRLISVSWVGYATGWRMDLDELSELAHRQGALLLVDAIQGLGVFPVDVSRTPIDFLAADGHKWLLGPEGAGLFYLRKEHLETLRPLNVGWNSVVQAHDFSHVDLALRPAAARYEGGSQNMVGFFGLGASLDLLVQQGLSRSESPIAERILQINEQIAGRLRELGATVVSSTSRQHGSGILACQLPGRDVDAVRRRCQQCQVALAVRGGKIRISPHAYVNDDDIDRLVAALCM